MVPDVRIGTPNQYKKVVEQALFIVHVEQQPLLLRIVRQHETDFVHGLRQLSGPFGAEANPCFLQAAYLLRKLMEQQTRDFVEQGGFTERLYEARIQARATDVSEAPSFPLCGGEMRQRMAGKRSNAGKPFWGSVPAIRS